MKIIAGKNEDRKGLKSLSWKRIIKQITINKKTC